MTEILRQKLLKLVRGDEGVALVITLALFMFLYISCAGVYTVGRAVKDRIILQNAVDAAAYSAAVVQADYLSRIATINRAMAWTYKSLVSSQMDWIALRTLSDSHEKYLQNIPQAVPEKIGAYLTPPLTMGIIAGSDEKAPLEDKIENDLLRVEELDELKQRIREYGDKLDGMNETIDKLRGMMKSEMEDAARLVLEANLPGRIGELCRRKFSMSVEYFDDEFSDEDRFTQLGNESNEKFKDQDWFGLDAESSSFTRKFDGVFKTFWRWQRKVMPYDIVSESFDAEDYKSDFPEAYFGFTARPLVLKEENYFSRGNPKDDAEFRSARGAITVAVAKWNENPWKQLVEDVTGIHAAFDYGEKNDWTFAIASAQAGYRSGGDDSQDEAREYSLSSDGFKGNNLSVTDWDAVYVPVRMAFKRDDFADWMQDGEEWKPLVPAGDREYVVEPLKKLRPYELNHVALARMHNNGGTKKILKWDEDGLKKFLDLMYH